MCRLATVRRERERDRKEREGGEQASERERERESKSSSFQVSKCPKSPKASRPTHKPSDQLNCHLGRHEHE